MHARSRFLTSLTLLAMSSLMFTGPIGCSRSKPRSSWWQFWKPKKVNALAVAEDDWDRKFIPPPDVLEQDVAFGDTGPLSLTEPPPPVPSEADLMNLPPTEGPRREARGMLSELVTVHFTFDSYVLDAVAREQLTRNLEWIESHPNVDIQIEGHCDERGTLEYNLLLGERRAKAVKAFLVRRGFSPTSLHTISYGEERPVDPGYSDVAFAKNRRAQFLVY